MKENYSTQPAVSPSKKWSFAKKFALIFTLIAFYLFSLFFLQMISPLEQELSLTFFFLPFIRLDLILISLPFQAIPLSIVFIFFYGLGVLIQNRKKSKNNV